MKIKTYIKFPLTITLMMVILTSVALGMTLKDNPKSRSGKIMEKSLQGGYSTYSSFADMLNATDARYFIPVRISPAGSKNNPTYHGFFFYNCSQNELYQFDPSGRYMLGMRVFIEDREVLPEDKGEIGIFDLQNNNKWIKIGETNAWNYQQGCRLQWIPGSFEEIIWNDRSADGKKFESRIYNTRTKKTRTLPIPIYTISPDGKTALSINFERIVHKKGCNYAGIRDPYENQWAPNDVGVWKMDMNTGNVKMIVSLREIAKVLYKGTLPADSAGKTLYFFREGFNPSGNRFIAFVRNARKESTRVEGFSIGLDGEDIKYLFVGPNHHFWINDEEIINHGKYLLPDGKNEEVLGYYRFKDDGTGRAKEKYFDAPNGHITIHKNGDWFLTDTYSSNGFLSLYMYHIPTKKFVPLAKLHDGFPEGESFRVDLHPRFSPDGKFVSFDSAHEGVGRQIYMMDISHIIDNPPEP